MQYRHCPRSLNRQDNVMKPPDQDEMAFIYQGSQKSRHRVGISFRSKVNMLKRSNYLPKHSRQKATHMLPTSYLSQENSYLSSLEEAENPSRNESLLTSIEQRQVSSSPMYTVHPNSSLTPFLLVSSFSLPLPRFLSFLPPPYPYVHHFLLPARLASKSCNIPSNRFSIPLTLLLSRVKLSTTG